MRLANHRPAEQSSGLPYSAHQQVVNAVKMNVNLHGAGNQKKQMLGGSVLRDEGSPGFEFKTVDWAAISRKASAGIP